jgi:hypothetical protein
MEHPPTAAETEAQWGRLHHAFALQLLSSGSVRDGSAGAGDASRIDERLVQAIWSDQMLKPGLLATASGKAVEVIEPGRWNTGPGPDFLDARVRIAGELREGDVEIHVQSADWRRHGHHQDFEYNRVVLHVVLEAHDDRPYEEKQNGERLERLVLDGVLEPDLETIRATVNVSDYPYGKPDDLGLCHEQFLRLPEAQLKEFLLAAGRSRVEQKIARFAAQRTTEDFLQVAHQALLTGQGYKASKTLYFLLAKRAPLRELMDHARDAAPGERVEFFLTVLLHLAQLMPMQTDLVVSDDETAAFTATLERLWKPVRPYFTDRLIPPTKRWFVGMRPAGFPTRRLTAVAVLLARLTEEEQPLLRRVQALIEGVDINLYEPKQLKEFWRKLSDLVVVQEEQRYFSTHFTFGGKKQPPQALLGEPAALGILFNVILPLLVLRARETKNRELERRAWAAILCFPALEQNSVVKFMQRRLLGESPATRTLFKREIFQQSLFKVFADCCAQNERTCDDCTFLALADRIVGEGPGGGAGARG